MKAHPSSEQQLALDYAPPRALRKPRQMMALRFKRDIRFPRFGVSAGEVWNCEVISRTGREYANAIATGADRFLFAGGQCLVADVEVLT